MKSFTTFIAYLALVAMGVGCSVLVMINGWGLQPKNWYWIIGVGVFVQAVLLSLLDKIRNEDKGQK